MISATAIYLLAGLTILSILTTVLFKTSIEFKKRCGLLPPDIIYQKDSFGLDRKDQILWKTPKTSLTGEDVDLARGFLFFLRWAGTFGCIFLFARLVIELLKLE